MNTNLTFASFHFSLSSNPRTRARAVPGALNARARWRKAVLEDLSAFLHGFSSFLHYRIGPLVILFMISISFNNGQ